MPSVPPVTLPGLPATPGVPGLTEGVPVGEVVVVVPLWPLMVPLVPVVPGVAGDAVAPGEVVVLVPVCVPVPIPVLGVADPVVWAVATPIASANTDDANKIFRIEAAPCHIRMAAARLPRGSLKYTPFLDGMLSCSSGDGHNRELRRDLRLHSDVVFLGAGRVAGRDLLLCLRPLHTIE